MIVFIHYINNEHTMLKNETSKKKTTQ